MSIIQITFAAPVVVAYLLIAVFAGGTLVRLFRDVYDRDGVNSFWSFILLLISCALLASIPVALRAGLERLS